MYLSFLLRGLLSRFPLLYLISHVPFPFPILSLSLLSFCSQPISYRQFNSWPFLVSCLRTHLPENRAILVEHFRPVPSPTRLFQKDRIKSRAHSETICFQLAQTAYRRPFSTSDASFDLVIHAVLLGPEDCSCMPLHASRAS